MSSPAPSPLSERERELMALVATGASNNEIALAMGISPNTVKVHLRNIFEKLGAASRTEASVIVLREGWVAVDGMSPPTEASDDAPLPDPTGADGPEEGAQPAPEPPPIVAADGPVSEGMALPPPRRAAHPSPWLIGAGTLLVGALLLIGALRLRAPQGGTGSTDATAIAAAALTDRWTSAVALPLPRTAALSVAVGRDLYLLGGEDADGVAGELWRSREGDVWEALAPWPDPRRGAALAAVGGALYVAGGEGASGGPEATLWRYEVATGQWQQAEIPLPEPLTEAALAAFEGDLYLFGGRGASGTSDRIYRLHDGAWSEVGRLPAARRALAAVVQPEGIVLLGGVDEGGRAVATSTLFDPRAAEPLSALPDLPTPAAAPRAVGLGGGLFLLEGTRLYERDPQGAWRQLEGPSGGLPARAALLAQDPYLLLVGGGDTTAPRSEVLRYEALFRTLLPIVPGQ